MNTIVRVPISGKIIHHPLLGDENPIKVGSDVDDLVLIVQPGSLHASGECYFYSDGSLYPMNTVLRKDDSAVGTVFVGDKNIGPNIWRVYASQVPSDLILPRREQDEIHRLANLRTMLYIIRVPALGLGSVSVEFTENMVPLMVPNTPLLERDGCKQQQKHVSKSHTVKQRSR